MLSIYIILGIFFYNDIFLFDILIHFKNYVNKHKKSILISY
jgi:hypothetical protein